MQTFSNIGNYRSLWMAERPLLAQFLGGLLASMALAVVTVLVGNILAPFVDEFVLAKVMMVFIVTFPIILTIGIDYFSIRLSEKRGGIRVSLFVAISTFIILLVISRYTFGLHYSPMVFWFIWVITFALTLLSYRVPELHYYPRDSYFISEYQIHSLFGLKEPEEGGKAPSFYDLSKHDEQFSLFAKKLSELKKKKAVQNHEGEQTENLFSDLPPTEAETDPMTNVTTPKEVFTQYLKV